ncbi:AAA family ATPase [Lichenibacterium minor]|uniref:AAA family ATPase n=1 Tax=Lichenibacterium minor TaxID=2316528 RepID=A0A4Q2U808_9HYPH|nr:ATP-binding protein [Lichenibacterium minor]RYC31261.1 AAA family ATPase [Lichenibacterium minor]
MGKVVYVTGAPASGKSTTTGLLAAMVPGIERWEYGARLTDHLRREGIDLADQNQLRRESSKVALAGTIRELDRLLLAFVEDRRGGAHVLIDSHPVTKEDYGFRVTAFSQSDFVRLRPDEIWVLYTTPEVAVSRIRDDPGGRPAIDIETARMHTFLQASVATTYGIIAGCPVHVFDTDRDPDALVRDLAGRLER